MISLHQDCPVRKPRILIVDDTPANIQILASALVKKYEILIATSGRAALELVHKKEKPDMILLDVMMPEMDGYEVCRLVKEDPATWSIPIVFITAKGDVTDQQHGFDLGAEDYIVKPFDLPLVIARINVHIRLKRKSDQLEHLALLDGLTDIPNRRALENTLQREFGRAQREGKPLSLLMVDVDYFKPFNDTYGHGAGDECLRTIAHTLEACLLRPGDFIGRYGGEEFLVVLPDCDQAGALVVAEKLRCNIEGLSIPHKESKTSGHVTISVGVKSFQRYSKGKAERMLQGVDRALYCAKERGRNQIAVDDTE